MRSRAFVLSLFLIGTGLTVQAQTGTRPAAPKSIPASAPPRASTPYGQQIFLMPGDSAERIFGNLLVRYRLTRPCTAVVCTLYVASQFVGIRQLSATAPVYNFDVHLGYGKAQGTIVLQLASPQQGSIPTLAGDFIYSTSDTKEMSTFKGDLIGLYSTCCP